MEKTADVVVIGGGIMGASIAHFLAKKKLGKLVLLEKGTFYTQRTYPYLMPAERSLDIDSEWDLRLAELIMNWAVVGKIG